MARLITCFIVQPDCTGLKTDWMSTLQTTTQFPVNPGTVVEVTCSETGAINTGSSEVTCTFDTYFTKQLSPSCSVLGKYIMCYTPLPKSSNPFPIGRIRLRPKINFQKFFIKVQKVRTEHKESKRNFISRVEKYDKAYLRT